MDVVVVAARYDFEGTLQLAQGFERRGAVWSDLLLFDRPALVERLRARRHVAVGSPIAVPGDYHIVADVRLNRKNGKATLVTDSGSGDRDHLGVPAF